MPKSEVYNCDCMTFMQGLKDNAFDLCIAINRGYLIETAMKQNGYPMLDVAGDLPF